MLRSALIAETMKVDLGSTFPTIPMSGAFRLLIVLLMNVLKRHQFLIFRHISDYSVFDTRYLHLSVITDIKFFDRRYILLMTFSFLKLSLVVVQWILSTLLFIYCSNENGWLVKDQIKLLKMLIFSDSWDDIFSKIASTLTATVIQTNKFK